MAQLSLNVWLGMSEPVGTQEGRMKSAVSSLNLFSCFSIPLPAIFHRHLSPICKLNTFEEVYCFIKVKEIMGNKKNKGKKNQNQDLESGFNKGVDKKKPLS